jgi:hypothetical protein
MIVEYQSERNKKQKQDLVNKVKGKNIDCLSKAKRGMREEIYNDIRKEVDQHHQISQTTKLLKKEKKLREADETFQQKRSETESRAEQIEL